MIDDFAERLASTSPTPGGGAAAARTGRHACALLRMVTGLSLEPRRGKPPADGTAPRALDGLREAAQQAERLQRAFEALEAEDMAAFEAYLEALRLPRTTPAEKADRLEAKGRAALRAAEAPIAMLRAAVETLGLAGSLLDLAGEATLPAESDLGIAVELAAAAFRSAEMLVRVNLPEVPAGSRSAIEKSWRENAEAVEKLHPELRHRMIERLGGN